MILASILEGRTQLFLLAGAAASLLVLFSFTKWRLAIKLAFLAVIFEGAIRKWVLPQGQELVYFLKDILLFGAYVRFFLFPEVATRARQSLAPSAAIFFALVIISLWALHPNVGSPLVAILAIKNYFYYLPLVIIVPHLYRDENEMLKDLSRYSLVAIPVCLLGVLQFFAPNASMLNVYAHDAASGEVLSGALMGEKQFSRITGTFSYITGLVTFVQVFTCIALVNIATGSNRYRMINSFVILPLLLAAGYMSGSRTAVFSQIAIIAGFVAAGSAIKLAPQKSTVLRLVLVLAVAVGSSMILFREAATAFYERTAYGGDRFMERLTSPVTSIAAAMTEHGALGVGIGVTHPACRALRRAMQIPEAEDQPEFESEPAQIMAELGIIGFLTWYALRFLLISRSISLFWLLRPGPAKALCVCVILLQIAHLLAQLVFNHTSNFFVWGLYGLCLTPTLHLRGRLGHHRAPTQTTPSPVA